MKIAIIVTEPSISDIPAFNALYINFASLYGLENVETTLFNAVGYEWPENPADYDGYLLTGSSANSYDQDDWILQLKRNLVELDRLEKKICGICFGHQIVAEALGGKVEKNPKGWELGQIDVPLTSEGQEFFGDFDIADRQSITILQIHQDIVTRVPPGMTVLASNDICKIQSLCKRSTTSGDAGASPSSRYHIITFQGHPEFTPSHLIDLIHNEISHVDEQVRQKAIATIKTNPDQQMFAQVINKFFSQ
ncbi:hypothetical protein SAMD00019534_105890 [Acytostelium subglobosum LB1]|uniref:hypothetical protein n=1 Tax=Acytostelium subglobosum LB1 TaxID=1410327 RepID=UPI0006448B5C|nr:hypothetical protein SAMD00019534_105890 [Acytostelium subglobosum LB1]GAM27413.1 hypothetical protein SAMD00019534_105890 [Acytostelium subglobosum LB1]|eukprot:XP_012749478.1 hypothetical protein SAMD00019534_105890 [Acytostelium subglobosum LB1]